VRDFFGPPFRSAIFLASSFRFFFFFISLIWTSSSSSHLLFLFPPGPSFFLLSVSRLRTRPAGQYFTLSALTLRRPLGFYFPKHKLRCFFLLPSSKVSPAVRLNFCNFTAATTSQLLLNVMRRRTRTRFYTEFGIRDLEYSAEDLFLLARRKPP
jgi:hypothetical protein